MVAEEFHMIPLVLFAAAAVLTDLSSGKIPNALIVPGLLCGFSYQIFMEGLLGIPIFLGGMFLPLLLFGVFYYFRMIGAGDIKLFCVAGGYLGISGCFSCILLSVLSGGVLSLILIVRRRIFDQRLVCFYRYMESYSRTKKWSPYLETAGESDRFCFSLPVLFGILCCVGGVI